MNKRLKTGIGILIFALFLFSAYRGYVYFSDIYKADNNSSLFSTESSQNVEKIPAPDFKLFDKDGNIVRLSDFAGKPIVLNFWASWCPPCQAEMPYLEQSYEENKADITYLMIDYVDGQRETQEKGQNYINEKGYSFPIYFDTELDAVSKYDVYSIPATYFIDSDGNIVSKHQGQIDAEGLEAGINQIK